MWYLVRFIDEVDEGKSKRGSVKEKERIKVIIEIYLIRLLFVKVGGGFVGGRFRRLGGVDFFCFIGYIVVVCG